MFLLWPTLTTGFLWPTLLFFRCFVSRERKRVGSSTETVAFQVYEILKINHE